MASRNLQRVITGSPAGGTTQILSTPQKLTSPEGLVLVFSVKESTKDHHGFPGRRDLANPVDASETDESGRLVLVLASKNRQRVIMGPPTGGTLQIQSTPQKLTSPEGLVLVLTSRNRQRIIMGSPAGGTLQIPSTPQVKTDPKQSLNKRVKKARGKSISLK